MNKSVLRTLLLTVSVCLDFCFTDTQIQAQNDTTFFMFPKFEAGMVKMKDGQTKKALLNYNKYTEEMTFEKDGAVLVLNNTESIDTVYIESHLFVPHIKAFYELLVKGSVCLFVQNRCKLEYSGDPSGYGGKTQTSAVENLSSITNSVNTYKLKLPDNYYIKDATLFWITRDTKFYKANSGSQIIKIFPEKSTEIKSFIKQNKLDLKKVSDLITLIVKCNEFVR